MIGYKLTDRGMETHGGFVWTLGVASETSGEGALCGPGWLHYYEHPLLAVLHNPRHAKFDEYRMFECEVGGSVKRDGYMKAGCTRMTLISEISPPELTQEQVVRYAIGCALSVYRAAEFRLWAEQWIDGSDRSDESAWAAAWAAADESAWAARAAADAAADESAGAARAAADAAAADESARAAEAAWAAARAEAARVAAKAPDLNLISIAEWAASGAPLEALERVK